MKHPAEKFAEVHDANLGRYQPIASLDQGGMARVLLALSRGPARVKKLVVIKEILADLASDAEFVAMFLDEARLASRLSHPNVIDIYEVGIDGSDPPRPFIVMEYLEGQSLLGLIARMGRAHVPLPIHLRVLVDALAGLHHAHELKDFDATPLQIVHRDVSPENVFVCYDGSVKLVDFGIAKAAGSASRTERGKFKGKLGYIAPEQIQGNPVDRRADIFSVGVMLWEALVGRRLTHGQTQSAIARSRMDGTQPRVLEARPDASPELAAICDRAMSLRAEDRYATAAELASAIENQMAVLGWRISDRMLATLMSEVFASDRAHIRTVIDQRIHAMSDTSLGQGFADPLPGYFVARASIPPTEPEPPERDEDAEPTRKRASVAPPPPTLPEPSYTMSDSRAFRPRLPLRMIAGILATITLTVVAIFLLRSLSTDTQRPAIATAPSVAAASPPAPAPSASIAQPMVQLQVSVVPASAAIELDGAPLGSNPFRGEVKRAAGMHRIVASAPGYVSQERSVSLEGDVILSLSLDKRPAGAAPPGTVPAALPEAGLDTELPKGGKPKRPIDSKDPYK
ncbi:MAG: serine/threonine protein kinase [Deltaproteobacteria bacterium]|nr:serine/threonine protein kinase [Deltaproteobacteria bacterium]